MVFIPSNAKDYNSKEAARRKKPIKKTSESKATDRFWGNAARLEHTNVRNKNKSKKGR
jgi:hypothetical protein